MYNVFTIINAKYVNILKYKNLKISLQFKNIGLVI